MRSRTSMPDLRTITDDGGVATELSPLADELSPALRLVEATNGAGHAAPHALESLVAELLTEIKSLQRRSARIVVKTDGRLLFLRVADVDWIEAAGNYVRVHVGTNAYMCRESMKNMEGRL